MGRDSAKMNLSCEATNYKGILIILIRLGTPFYRVTMFDFFLGGGGRIGKTLYYHIATVEHRPINKPN